MKEANCNIVTPVVPNTINEPTKLTTKPTIHATPNWYSREASIILFPYSFLIVAKVAIHGVYKAQKTKKV